MRAFSFFPYLGVFFTECGMFQSAKIVLSCTQFLQQDGDDDIYRMSIELWTRYAHFFLLHINT